MAYFSISHRMNYRYDREVFVSPQIMRLYPHVMPEVRVEKFQLIIEPSSYDLFWKHDISGNRVAKLAFLKPINYLNIYTEMTVQAQAINPFAFILDDDATSMPVRYSDEDNQLLQAYKLADNQSHLRRDFITPFSQGDTYTVTMLGDLAKAIKKAVVYEKRFEHGILDSATLLKEGKGSCRDKAWFFIQCVRDLFLAARFVSGYAVQPNGMHDTEMDDAELHAWAEVYLPGAGWVGIDPTAGLFINEWYVPLAVAAKPESAAVLSGTISPCESQLFHEIQVKYHTE